MSGFSCDASACQDFIACDRIEPVRPGGLNQGCKFDWWLMIGVILIANVQVRKIKGVADKAFGGTQLIVSGKQSFSAIDII